jgi:uncharacterized membrane protein YkvA (DUF1232 family)
MGVFQVIRTWATRIKRDAITLWFAKSHPRTPWGARALGVFVVAYTLSPIDLIPDFIPVLGYLDDVIVLPVLIWMTVRMLPADVLTECRQQAEDWLARAGSKPRSVAGGVLVVAIWAVIGVPLLWLLSAFLSSARELAPGRFVTWVTSRLLLANARDRASNVRITNSLPPEGSAR